MTAIKNGTLLVKDSNGNTARVATLSQADITTLNTALADIDANKRKISSISANYVTTDTAQTITGQKTLLTNSKRVVTKLKITDADNTVTPTSNLWTNPIAAFDKNDKIMGALQFARTTEGNTHVGIQAMNQNSNGYDVSASISIGVNNEGVVTTRAPTPSVNSNDLSIATTEWVNNKVNPIKNNYVTTNTAQTITGKKTLTTTNKTEVVTFKVTNTDSTVTPTENLWVDPISCIDKNNKLMGNLQFTKRTDGSHWVGLQAANQNSNGNNIFHSLGIGLRADGTALTSAPNPKSDSNDFSIATTAWVNDKVNPIKNNYVTTNTAQDITAIKTIVLPSNQHAIIVKDKSIANTDTPSPSAWQSMVLTVDKNGKERGCAQSILRHDGSSCTKLMAIQQNAKGENIYNSLELSIKADGTRHTYVLPPSSNSNDNSIATTKWVRSYIMPAGTIIPFAGSSIPTGYLLCNGAVVSRTTYANLFKVIGTTYGAGDGSTTFKLPDLRDRFLEGAGTNAVGRYLSAGLPNIAGDSNLAAYWDNRSRQTGCYLKSEDWSQTFSLIAKSGNMSSKVFRFDANSSNTTYGSSSTVQPKSMVVQYLIKY